MSTPSGPRLAGLAPANDPVMQAGIRLTPAAGGAPGAASKQSRTFKLMARVSAAYSAFRFPSGKQPADTDPTTLDTGSPAAGRTFAWQEYFKADNTRLQVYEDVEEMDETTDEISAALDTLADSAVNPEDGSQHTFVIEIDEGPYRDQAQDIFDQVTESLDLQRLAFPIARTFLKYGDCFVEMVVDEANLLARSKILPPKTMWRNEDVSGNMMRGEPRYDVEGRCLNEAGECAFDQRESLNGKMLAAFSDWQITHFRWNRRGNERYGRSMLRTARLVWKKLKACEEALVIARLQRAWMRFAHYVDTTGMTAEEARAALIKYRQELTKHFILDTQMRESPFEVTSDFYLSGGYVRDLDGNKFLPKQSKIEVLQGDHAVLAAIHDIEYFQNKLFASLRVPKAYLGFERDINARATLTTQDIQFARVLRRVQAVLSEGYKEFFDFALMLNGIDPSQVAYSIHWPAILVSDEERDALIRRMHAQADATYWQMGAPSTRYFVQARFGMDDEAWEADLRDAAYDPPPRLKPTVLGMPHEDIVQSPTSADPAAPAADYLNAQQQQLAKAIAGANDQGTITDAPPDVFNQSKASDDMEKRSSTGVQQRSQRRRNPTTRPPSDPRNTASEGEALEEGAYDPDPDHDGDVDDPRAPVDLDDFDLFGNPLLHGMGGNLGRAQDAAAAPLPPRVPRSRIFVPGMRHSALTTLRRTDPGSFGELAVAGVHGLHRTSTVARVAMRPGRSGPAASAAQADLHGFTVNMLARKRAAAAALAADR